MAKRLNPRRVSIHRSYEYAEAARRLGVHKNTVRNWVRSGELPAFTEKRPHIVLGADLRAVLEKRRSDARTKCPPNHLYCLRCRAPRAPAGMTAVFVSREYGAGNLRAVCAACGGKMHQRCDAARLSERFPDVQIAWRNADSSGVESED